MQRAIECPNRDCKQPMLDRREVQFITDEGLKWHHEHKCICGTRVHIPMEK